MQKVAEEKNEVKYVGNVSKKVVNKDSIEAMTEKEDVMVSGVFKNLENPGDSGFISCRFRKGQPIFTKRFFDGEIATIPLSVAKHINQRCAYEKHGYEIDDKGNHKKIVESRKQRYQFVSTDYM